MTLCVFASQMSLRVHFRQYNFYRYFDIGNKRNYCVHQNLLPPAKRNEPVWVTANVDQVKVHLWFKVLLPFKIKMAIHLMMDHGQLYSEKLFVNTRTKINKLNSKKLICTSFWVKFIKESKIVRLCKIFSKL